MADYLVCASHRVLLPGFDDTQPATITIDTSSGKITDVHLGKQPRETFPENVQYLDVGDKVILPGLVEYVGLYRVMYRLDSTSLPSVPTYTSMNPDVRIGRVSGQAHERRRREELLLLWICRSTLSPQRCLWPISNRNGPQL